MKPENIILLPLKTHFLLRSTLVCMLLLSYFNGFTNSGIIAIDLQDSMRIKKQLEILRPFLNYPNSSERFYRQHAFQKVWIYPNTVKTPLYQGMLLLDCVMQYGLNHADFHPTALSYAKLQPLLINDWTSYGMDREVFDLYMTDAMLTIINHLRFGKFNPSKTGYVLDRSDENYACDLLSSAIKQKDFISAILLAQPQEKNYKDLQQYLRLVKGQYTGDCYEFPEGEARKIAVNMERMRWLSSADTYYLQINIPSFLLTLQDGDNISIFKVVVGKPSSPSPQLESNVKYLTTAPEWNVPTKIFIRELLPKALKDPSFLEKGHYGVYGPTGEYIYADQKTLKRISANPRGYSLRQSSGCENAMGRIVFRFPNLFDVYLHDTPEQKLFNHATRAFSHGCIRVEGAEKLATMLLIHDGGADKPELMKKSLQAMEKKDFYLSKSVPIRITYFTAELIDGMLKIYPDIYKLDPGLEKMMFPPEQKWARDQ